MAYVVPVSAMQKQKVSKVVLQTQDDLRFRYYKNNCHEQIVVRFFAIIIEECIFNGSSK